MTLDRNGKLVKWAYFLEGSKPGYTSLCALFWRTVLFTPLKMLAILGGIGMVTAATWMVLRSAIAHASLIGLIVVIATPLVVIGMWLFKPRGYMDAPAKRAAMAIRHSIVVQGAIAVKSKICPLIELRQF